MRQCRRAAAALLGVAVGNFAHAAANKSITQYWQSVPTLHEPSNRLQYRKALCLRVFQNDHVLPFLIAQCCIKISIPLMAVPFCQKIPHCATLAVVIFLWQHTTGGVDNGKRPRRALLCMRMSRGLELHHVAGLGRIQKPEQGFQGLPLFFHVVVPVIVPRLHTADAVGLQPAPNV